MVYRKVYLTANELKRYQNAFKNDTQIKEYAFISTSKSRLNAMHFPGNCLFRIHSKTGKEIEKIAKFDIEKEILFRPNINFKVLEIGKEDNYTLITMEEI